MNNKQKLNKTLSFVLALSMTILVVGFANASKAATTDCENSTLGKVFGCSGIFGGGDLDLSSIVQVFFILIVAVGFAWTAYHLALAGIKLGGAQQDVKKREEGIEAIKSAALGFIVTLVAGGATFTIARLVGGPVYELSSMPCFAKDSKGVSFAGFVSKDDPEKCVLTDAQGREIKSGTREKN